MTWNVWWRFGDAWREREAGLVTTLREVRPDLLALQETWSGEGTTQADVLAERLGGLAAVWAPTSLPPAPPGGIDVGIALLSRWPIVATVVHELPHPQWPGPPPTALEATVDGPGGRLRVIVTCLEWEPSFARDHLLQSYAVAELAAAGDGPVLVLGDLNAAVDQPELTPLLAVLDDAWALGGGDPGAVTLSSAVPEAPREAGHLIDRRIDHILVRGGLTAHRAFLAGDHPIDGRHPSDHYAVVADVGWE